MDETCGTVAFSHKSMPSGIAARTWYRIVGRVGNGRPPLVVLHGGPGYTHAYLKPAFDLFSRTTSTPVIYYDQFGNGNSTHLREKRLDESFWTVDIFTQELDNLLTKLDIVGDFNLYGHSWGAMLAISYVSRYQPKGLRKLVLGSGPASMVLWKEAARGFLEQLPPHMMERLDTTKPWEELEGDDDYLEALAALNKKTTLMDEPFPEELQESLNWLNEDDTVVLTANGPSDLITGGSMKGKPHKTKPVSPGI